MKQWIVKHVALMTVIFMLLSNAAIAENQFQDNDDNSPSLSNYEELMDELEGMSIAAVFKDLSKVSELGFGYTTKQILPSNDSLRSKILDGIRTRDRSEIEVLEIDELQDDEVLSVEIEEVPEELGEIELDLSSDLDIALSEQMETASPLDLLTGDADVAAQTDAATDRAVASNAAKKNTIPKTLKLGVKETYTLGISGVTCKTSKKSVATVSKKGVITAKKKGTAKITIMSGKKTIATCKVTVLAAPKKVTLSEIIRYASW